MKKHINKIAFSINEKEKIVLSIDDSLNETSCCYDGLISLIQQGKVTLLSDDDVLDNMRVFAVLLERVLINSLLLDSSLDDVGYVYNQYCDFLWSKESSMTIDDFFYENGDKDKDWVGMRYYLWAGGNSVTWLYNNQDGEIILNVSSFYPFIHAGTNEEPNYIPYQEWIKGYKPYFTTVISKDLATQWLQQANEIIQQIEANIQRFKKEHEQNCGHNS